MRLSRAGMAALRELARRRPVPIKQDGPDAHEAAAGLRRMFYPKQAAFFASPTRLKATRKTRRMGATTGGVRELLARSLEMPGFRATYATSTRGEAISRAWRNDNKTGFIDVLDELAEPVKHPSLTAYKLGGITIEVRETDLKLEFSNGSQIELFGAENFRGQKRKRGNSKHVFWIDEAQDFVNLESFFDAVVIGSTTDYEGEIWLTGTPGQDCAGMFYDVTKEPEDGEAPIASWEVHEISVTDNPYFGHVIQTDTDYYVEDNARPPNRHGPYETRAEADRAAEQVRWDRTAGEAMRLKGWKGDEPDFVREWRGKWVRADARYVYPVHAVPRHTLLFAPQRLRDNPFVGTDPRFDGHPAWYDHHAALADLPRPPRGRGSAYQWLFGLWADFGYHPDPFALVFGAFTPDLNDVYEMFSWKCQRVHTDDQAAYMKLLFEVSNSIVSFVGDPAGKQDDFAVWQSRMNLPIEEANKKGKNTLEEFLADDIRRGRVHFREGSPLVTEMRHLVYLPGKPGKTREVHKHRKVNGIVHGDHCCFVAGTMVETQVGPLSIEQVPAGELVYTRDGLRRVDSAFSSGFRDVWRLICDDGRQLVGTSDHPIWTDSGWIPLAALTPGVTLTTWESTVQARQWYSTDSDIDAIPSQSIGRPESTSGEPLSVAAFLDPNRSTWRSGSRQTDQCQLDTTSIIEMTTPSTTPLVTSNSWTEQNTSASMPCSPNERTSHDAILERPETPRDCGTGPRRASPGMLSMGSDVRWFGNPSGCSVSAADLVSSPRSQTRSFVATPARQQHAGKAESTTSIGHAWSAAYPSESIVTQSSRVAPIRVLRVERLAQPERVYNITVEGVPEFFANGVLVHNCDAARYGYADLTHYLAKLPKDKPPPGSREAWAAEAEHEERGVETAEQRRAAEIMERDEQIQEFKEGFYEWQ